jgi:hypothetical protein
MPPVRTAAQSTSYVSGTTTTRLHLPTQSRHTPELEPDSVPKSKRTGLTEVMPEGPEVMAANVGGRTAGMQCEAAHYPHSLQLAAS